MMTPIKCHVAGRAGCDDRAGGRRGEHAAERMGRGIEGATDRCGRRASGGRGGWKFDLSFPTFRVFRGPLPSFPMAKIEVSQVAEILKKHKIEPELLREIVEAMNEATQPAADEDIKPPPPKKQFVILLSDPAGKLPQKDLVGWVVQIPESASPYSTTDRIFKGAYDFNASKRGRMLPVKSVGEALESAGAKYFKESELWVKTKLPVAVVVTDNVLPKDEFKTEKVDRRRKDDED